MSTVAMFAVPLSTPTSLDALNSETRRFQRAKPQPPQNKLGRRVRRRINNNDEHVEDNLKQRSVSYGGNPNSLFPCPMMDSIDLDSPDESVGSLASLGILSQRSQPISRRPHCTRPPLPFLGKFPIRQQSLPNYGRQTSNMAASNGHRDSVESSINASPGTASPLESAAINRATRMKQTRSLHAQTHKLRRQVTIREDSVSSRGSLHCSQSSLTPSLSHRGNNDEIGHQRALQLLEEEPLQPQTQLPRQESSFTQEELLSLQLAFAKLDLDGNGRLSRQEVETALGKILSCSDLHTLIAELNTDDNGDVEWHAFLHTMKNRMREPETVKMLKEAFRVLAGSERDLVSSERMRSLLLLGHDSDELDEMISSLDSDQDGQIGIDDFIRLLMHRPEQRPRRTQRSFKCCIL